MLFQELCINFIFSDWPGNLHLNIINKPFCFHHILIHGFCFLLINFVVNFFARYILLDLIGDSPVS